MRSKLQADRNRLTNQVRQLGDEGLSYGKIGKALGIPRWLARKLNLKDVRPIVITKANAMAFVRQVWELRNLNFSDPEIAQILDVSYDTVRNWAGPRGDLDKVAKRKAKVLQLHSEGVRYSDIVKETRTPGSSVSKWIRQAKNSS